MGGKVTFSLKSDAVSGIPSPDLTQCLSRHESMDAGEPEIGTVMFSIAVNGSEMPGMTYEINGDLITVDFNRPLVGQIVHFDTEVLEIDLALEV